MFAPSLVLFCSTVDSILLIAHILTYNPNPAVPGLLWWPLTSSRDFILGDSAHWLPPIFCMILLHDMSERQIWFPSFIHSTVRNIISDIRVSPCWNLKHYCGLCCRYSSWKERVLQLQPLRTIISSFLTSDSFRKRNSFPTNPWRLWPMMWVAWCYVLLFG